MVQHDVVSPKLTRIIKEIKSNFIINNFIFQSFSGHFYSSFRWEPGPKYVQVCLCTSCILYGTLYITGILIGIWGPRWSFWTLGSGKFKIPLLLLFHLYSALNQTEIPWRNTTCWYCIMHFAQGTKLRSYSQLASSDFWVADFATHRTFFLSSFLASFLRKTSSLF